MKRLFSRSRQRLFTLALVVALALLGLGVAIWPAWAAIQLEYFIVVPTQRDVTLQWATAAEYDLSGFEIFCKQDGQLDNAYHRIGEVPAEGSPQQGATYVFPIFSGLERGVAYCFRLREVPITGEPGDFFDRCGYGLGIAPSPAQLQQNQAAAFRATQNALDITATVLAADSIATALAGADATIESLRATAAVTTTPTLTTALQLAPTLTAIALISPTLTAIAEITLTPPIMETPTPDFSIEGIPPVSVTLTALSLAFAATQTAVVAESLGIPIDTPTPDLFGLEPLSVTLTAISNEFVAAQTALAALESNELLETPTPTATLFGDSPLPTPNGFIDQSQLDEPIGNGFDHQADDGPEDGSDNSLDESGDMGETESLIDRPPADAPFATEPATPTPQGGANLTDDPDALAAVSDSAPPASFVVLTAAPTTPITPVPPTLTPLPPATEAPAGFNLANLMSPGAQNLTLSLLCLTFFTASGLGILGLITSAIYMRSQRRDADDDEPRRW